VLIIISILAAGLCLIPGPARSVNFKGTPTENRSNGGTLNFVPDNPREVGFDDVMPDATLSKELIKLLSPATPCEATFTDDNDLKTSIAPETPKEAGFDDDI
jgi:hypothetical protein